MSANDSSTLIDSPAASKLGPNRALFYSEEENRIEKFRPYGLPDPAWLEHVAERFAAKPKPEPVAVPSHDGNGEPSRTWRCRSRLPRRRRGPNLPASVRCSSMSTMTTQLPGPTKPSLALQSVYRMTVDEYERLVDAGALDDPRIELIDGYLVKKMGKKPPHVWSADAIVDILKAMLPGRWCRKEDPVRIPEFDEPEPDASVVRGSRDDYRNKTAGADDAI